MRCNNCLQADMAPTEMGRYGSRAEAKGKETGGSWTEFVGGGRRPTPRGLTVTTRHRIIQRGREGGALAPPTAPRRYLALGAVKAGSGPRH
jgi:hypothetical protein